MVIIINHYCIYHQWHALETLASALIGAEAGRFGFSAFSTSLEEISSENKGLDLPGNDEYLGNLWIISGIHKDHIIYG